MLDVVRMEQRFQLRAEEAHPVELIGPGVGTHPYEMDVIGHQAIGGAEDVLARCGVEHQFAEPLVEGFRQPSRRPFFEGKSPVNERRALVAFSLQARQMALMGAGVSRSRRRKEAG